MVRTQIQLSEEQMRDLRELSRKRGISIAEIIRQSIDQYLKTSIFISMDERRRRAIEIVGKFHSEGPGDVSERHDDYLDEIYGTW